MGVLAPESSRSNEVYHNASGPAATAILEFFSFDEGVLIFLIKAGQTAPLLFRAGNKPDGQPVTDDVLRAVATRLLVDFHGLPPGWDGPYQAQRYRPALALPPVINAAKRGAPILQRKLRNPVYQYEMTYLDDLSDALLPADLRPNLDGVEVLCIVPHGPLHALPLGALRWSQEQRLFERFGLCHLPSASLLSYCQAKNRWRHDEHRESSQSCLVAAVAAGDDSNPAEFEADGETLVELFSGRKGPTDRLVGAQGPMAASKAAVVQALDGHDVIHLACHGAFAEDEREDPMDRSGLLLSDGSSIPSLSAFAELSHADQGRYLLSARDVLSSSLHADLVTLRACSSGRTAVQSGDDLLGLTRAFLYAGTPSLVVSLWNVNQESSRMLLAAFYHFWLIDGLPKWRALQKAQARLKGIDGYEHLYHWAPFILVGDWY